jgi:hypothetical protein
MAARLDYRANLHRRALSRVVQRWRDAAGLSGGELAIAAGWSAAKMSMLLNACQAMSEADFLTLAMLLKADPVLRDRGLHSVRDASGQGEAGRKGLKWTVADIEAEAAELYVLAGDLVPPLLRTQAYDEAVQAAQIAGCGPVYTAAERDAVLAQLSAAITLRVHLVLGEGAVRRLVGGKKVMRDQLLWLMRLAELTNVTVQVLPDVIGAYAGMGPSFTCMSFVQRQFDGIVCVPQLREPIWSEAADEIAFYEQTFAAASEAGLSEEASIVLLLDSADG